MAVLCRGLEKNGMVRAGHGHGMGMSWHGKCEPGRPQCVNQMGKTHSKQFAARHSRGTAWARHVMGDSAFNVDCVFVVQYIRFDVSLITGIWAGESSETHFVDV
jgi:hypothetical protein